MSTTVTYKGSTLTTVNNETKTLDTAGTWLEDDLTLVDVSSGGSGEWTTDGVATNAEPSGAIVLSPSVTEVGPFALTYRPITSIYGSEVTRLRDSMLRYCHSLISVDFPKATVTVSGENNNIANCNKLETINLPLLTTLGQGTFSNCPKLTSVNIPKVTTLRPSTFLNCYILPIVDLGADCTQIQVQAFQACRALQTLVLRSSTVVTLANVNAFTNTPMRGYNSLTGTIYVPSALISSYQTATNWSTIYADGYVTFSAIEGSQYEL